MSELWPGKDDTDIHPQTPSGRLDEEMDHPGEDQAVDALTVYFRRASRGRIVDLPRWAQ